MNKKVFKVVALFMLLLCCGANASADDNVVSTDFTNWPFYTTNKQSDGGAEVHFFIVKVRKIDGTYYLNGVPFQWFKNIRKLQDGKMPDNSRFKDNSNFIKTAARQKYIKMLTKYPLLPIFSIENDGMYFQYNPSFEDTFEAYNATLSDTQTDFLDDAALNFTKKNTTTAASNDLTPEYYEKIRGYMGTDKTYAKEKGIEKYFILAVGTGKTIGYNQIDGSRIFDYYGNIKMKITSLCTGTEADAADDFTAMKNGEWKQLDFTNYDFSSDSQDYTVSRDLVNLQDLYNEAQEADKNLEEGKKPQTPTIYTFIPFTLKKFEHAPNIDYGIRMFFNAGPLLLHAKAIEYDKDELNANVFNQWDFNAGGIVDHYEVQYSTASVSPTEENWMPYPGYQNIPSRKGGLINNFHCIQNVDLSPIYENNKFIDDKLQFRIKAVIIKEAVDAGFDSPITSNVIKAHFTEELPYVSKIHTNYTAQNDKEASVSFKMNSSTLPASVRNNSDGFTEYTEYVIVRDGDYQNYYTLKYKLDANNNISMVKDTIHIDLNTSNDYKVITGYSFTNTSANTVFASPASNSTDVFGNSISVDITPSIATKPYGSDLPNNQTNNVDNLLTIDKIVNEQKDLRIERRVFYSTQSQSAGWKEITSYKSYLVNPTETILEKSVINGTNASTNLAKYVTTTNDKLAVTIPEPNDRYWVKFEYKIILTDTKSNTATSTIKKIYYYYDKITTSIDNVDTNNSIEVYPNPATSVINVKGDDVKSVEIFDMSGRCLISSNQASTSVDHLTNGCYLVRVNGNKVIRLIKE